MLKKIAASMTAVVLLMCTGALSAVSLMPDTEITASAVTNYYKYGDFRYAYDDTTDTVKITRYSGSDASVTIPSVIKGGEHDGKKVTAIGTSSFSDSETITSVTIPDSVTVIGCNAFYDCQNLKTVNIPDSVQVIEDYAFMGCKSLKSIHIPDGVTDINFSSFQNCRSLTSITIPDTVTRIGAFAFSHCVGLTSVTFSKNLTSISERAFLDCTSLKTVSIPSTVERINGGAFGFLMYKNRENYEKMSDFKLYCYPDTGAFKYAVNSNIVYQVYEPSEYPGNVNGDGKIDIADVSQLMNHINGMKALTGAQFKRADVNGDGAADIGDVAAICNHINGLKTLY